MTKTHKRDARSYRLTNIDFLRGLVIVLMALDHARDFFHTGAEFDPLAQPDVPLSLYLTRWVTHFCAPVFVFLAGTSAGLMAARKKPRQLGAFLAKRGAWLLFVEVALISTALTFSPLGLPEFGGATMVGLQVIWAIGGSMLALAALQFLGPRACFVLGALILLGHNLLDPLWPQTGISGESTSLLSLLFYQGSFSAGPFHVFLVYPLAAWIGVTLLGFGSAFVFELDSTIQDKVLIGSGLVFLALFLLLRGTGLYGDPNPWGVHAGNPQATAFDFMNLTKYPPSLLFLLATLGPMAILCGLARRIHGPLKDILIMFGRVPFLFYVAHLYLLHLMAVLLGMLQGFEAGQMATFMPFFPDGYGVGLAGVYAAWLAVLCILYFPCRWMARLKKRRKDWWLSYL